MPSLRELQTGVLEALLGGAPARAVPLVSGSADTATRRLAIYENTVFANVLGSLRATFPVVERLVGSGYFSQTARGFWRLHPSSSGDLQHVGAAFPGHLALLHGADDFAYLADVARLEWLCDCARLAAVCAPLDLTRLSGIDPGRYDHLHFLLHPGLGLFESRFPALRIVEAHADADIEPPPIDLTSGGDRLAVLRAGSELLFLRLNRGEFAFLSALDAGAEFAAAVESGSLADTQFDAATALRRLVGAQAIVDFR